MEDFLAVYRSEWKQIRARLGGPVALLVFAVIAVLLCFVVPRMWGYQFLDPKITLIYLALALLFVMPQAADSFGSPASLNVSVPVFVSGKLAALATYGWGVAVILLALALVVLNVLKRAGGRLLPDAAFLAGAILMTLLLTVFVAELAALVTLQLGSADVAKRILRIAMFVVVAALVFGTRSLPSDMALRLELATLTGPFRTALFLAAPGLALMDLLMLRALVGALSGQR